VQLFFRVFAFAQTYNSNHTRRHRASIHASLPANEFLTLRIASLLLKMASIRLGMRHQSLLEGRPTSFNLSSSLPGDTPLGRLGPFVSLVGLLERSRTMMVVWHVVFLSEYIAANTGNQNGYCCL
jgi:hypothetical protein